MLPTEDWNIPVITQEYLWNWMQMATLCIMWDTYSLTLLLSIAGIYPPNPVICLFKRLKSTVMTHSTYFLCINTEKCTYSWLGLWRWHVDSHCPAETKKNVRISKLSISHWIKKNVGMSTHWQISHWLEPFVRNQASMHDLWDLARPPRHRHPSSIKASSFSCWHTLLTMKRKWARFINFISNTKTYQFTLLEPS